VAKTEDKIPMGFAIEDDHIPFLRRGVEILHVIDASPSRGFPVVWHNMKGIPDDGEHLDLDTVEDWGTLITAFAAAWMELEGFMPSATNKDPSMQDTGTKRSMHGSKQPNKKTEL
jgi:hypothetical protein